MTPQEKRLATRIKNGHAKPSITVLCTVCKTPFTKPDSSSMKRVKTCSRVCGGKSRGFNGSNHPYWKGGSFICKEGYKMVRHGKWYITEHRLKMENHIGRKLTKNEVVHHWDKNRLNNNLDNLCLMRSQSAHRKLHSFAERHGLKVGELKFDQPWLTP